MTILQRDTRGSLARELLQSLSPMEASFLARHQRLVVESGGVIDDDFFVTKPGCLVIASSAPTAEAEALFGALNLDSDASPIERFVELNSRITYLSFRERAESSQAYHERMAKELGHLSVWGSVYVSFMLAGVALETSLELLAHTEAKAARLTSSKTKAMNAPLYRIQGSTAEQAFQKTYLLQQLAQRSEYAVRNQARELSTNANEFFNMLAPGAKATSLVYTMSLKDYHKLFIGRLSEHGNECEVQEICGRMCDLLHARYPIVIRPAQEYYKMNNSAKYSV